MVDPEADLVCVEALALRLFEPVGRVDKWRLTRLNAIEIRMSLL
jgi:hypothetical protein